MSVRGLSGMSAKLTVAAVGFAFFRLLLIRLFTPRSALCQETCNEAGLGLSLGLQRNTRPRGGDRCCPGSRCPRDGGLVTADLEYTC